jgi:hypothetical protein
MQTIPIDRIEKQPQTTDGTTLLPLNEVVLIELQGTIDTEDEFQGPVGRLWLEGVPYSP